MINNESWAGLMRNNDKDDKSSVLCQFDLKHENNCAFWVNGDDDLPLLKHDKNNEEEID